MTPVLTVDLPVHVSAAVGYKRPACLAVNHIIVSGVERRYIVLKTLASKVSDSG